MKKIRKAVAIPFFIVAVFGCLVITPFMFIMDCLGYETGLEKPKNGREAISFAAALVPAAVVYTIGYLITYPCVWIVDKLDDKMLNFIE